MTITPYWVIAVVCFLSGCASTAGEVVREKSSDVYSMQDDKGNSIRLHDEVCPGTPDWLDLRLAEMRYQGKDYKACWFPIESLVIILDDAKDKTPIPFGAFKKEVPL